MRNEFKLTGKTHKDRGIDEVLFVPDDKWSSGKGSLTVYHYTTIVNEYDIIGKITRTTDEDNITAYTSVYPDGKQFMPPSRDIKPIIKCYSEIGDEINFMLRGKDAEWIVKEFHRKKKRSHDIER
jgi:hypothetical protein